MIKVCSSQYNNFFGNNQIHFPYSIASLISYSLKFQEIKDKFFFEKVFLFRDNVETDIQKAKNANILLCSCYSWNWEITNYLARNVKKDNPNCLIIFGGPEVPDITTNFFDNHPYVDILVHKEGEVVLSNILKEYLNGLNLEKLNIKSAETKYNKPILEDRIVDLDTIPSPYSMNLIWDLVEKGPNYIVSWETNRGCPFSCTFCDWGSSTLSKLRCFSENKLHNEIEWLGKNKITYLDCCDSNYGIFTDRDYRLSVKLAETKEKYGFPERLNLTWVKTSSEKIIPNARVLSNAGLLRAVSLSIQSLDKNVLRAIKRKNLKFDTFDGLVKRFDDENIQSYTEMIMGLPEETVESFKNNWEILASLHPQPCIMVWNCSVFVNAPMNDKSYIEKYGIEVFSSPVFMAHTSKKNNEIIEYEKMVRATNTLLNGKIKEVYIFNWIMMVFHVFGILEYISRYYEKSHNISFVRFYAA